MKETTVIRYIDVADAAKMLRADLRAAFPGTRFSVRLERFSGGASINIRWTGAPDRLLVEQVANRYRGTDFDGQTDSTTVRPPVELEGELVHFGVDFVFCTRREL